MTDENQNGYSFLAETASRKQEETTPEGETASGVEGNSDEGLPFPEEKISAAGSVHEEENHPDEESVLQDQPDHADILASAPPTLPARYTDSGMVWQKKGTLGKFFRRTGKFVAAALVFGTIAGGAFIGFNELYYHLNPSARPSYHAGTAEPGTSNASPQSFISYTAVSPGTSVATADVSSIVDTAMPSLVSISCTFRNTTSFFGYLYEGTTEGSGSGIIVGKNDTELLIATNNHVVDDAITTTITFLDGNQVDATVRGTEEAADLAIVSVPLADIPQETLAALTTAILGNSDEVRVGQMVIAIGNSLGYGQTTTVGYLSAKEREITVADSSTGKSVNYTALQVDAAINPGNSGGALLDTNGRVIGINSAKLSSTNVEGIGYAIPINDAIDILTELMNREILTDEERGYLGVYLSEQEITAEISRLYGFPRGVYIANVVEGGAAAAAGIVSGDIVTAINGSAVTARTQLQEKVNSYRAGTEIEVTLARLENGEYVERNVTVVLGSKADFD